MDTMVNETFAEFLPRFIKEMSIGPRRRTAPPGGFSPLALVTCIRIQGEGPGIRVRCTPPNWVCSIENFGKRLISTAFYHIADTTT